MRKFIFFTDVHLRLTPPKFRADNFFEAQLAKLVWIGERARELDCPFVVCGGDLGDSFDWKISTVNRVAEIFANYPCPVYCIIGNHDVPGRNPENIRDTGLQALHDSKLTKGMFHILFEPLEIEGFYLHPFHSDAKDTELLISNRYDLEYTTDLLKVAVVHAPIGAETTPWCKGHKELLILDFDFALFGDIHEGWTPWASLTGCKLINPGSMSRLTKKDAYRIPRITIVSEDGIYSEEPIPCADKSVAFYMDRIEHVDTGIGTGFLKTLAERSKGEVLTPLEKIEVLGKKGKFSRQSIQLLKDSLK